MKELKIVFMGTPDFAVATLKTIVENNYNVVGVITAPDKPAGRGRKLKASAIKEYALSKKLKVLQPTNLKDEFFLKELKALEVNLNVVVAFRMLPKVVWNMPEFGTFNLHASLLPEYRGAAPINWAVINGETRTGVTTFFIDDKIDTGEIIIQEEVSIENNDTAGDLHDRLMHDGSDLVLKTIKLIEKGKVTTKPQPKTSELKTANKLNKENTKINWNCTSNVIYNHIRGLSPFPTAWCYLYNNDEEVTIKIQKATIDLISHTMEAGSILIEDKILKVAVKDGFIIVEKLQLPGKRALDTSALLNGYRFDGNAQMR